MKNPFLEEVEQLLDEFGMHGAKLTHESYHHQSFGNAEAIFTFGNVRLRFVRDRDGGSVLLGSHDPSTELNSFVQLAVWRGWLKLEELRTEQPRDFDQPPPPPRFSLRQMLSLVAQDLNLIEQAFAPDEVDATLAKLKKIECDLSSIAQERWSRLYGHPR